MAVLIGARRRMEDGVVFVAAILIAFVHGEVAGHQFWDDLADGVTHRGT